VRAKAIEPFMVEQKTDFAIQLAEKYKEFRLLAMLVETDSKLLEYYMNKFRAEQFPQYVYKMYLDQGTVRSHLVILSHGREISQAF
jgi:hypothetical protein